VGVSAALTIGMAIGTGVLYSQLRKTAEVLQGTSGGRGGGWRPQHRRKGLICAKFTDGRPALATRASNGIRRHKAFLATAVLTGVFAASTAVFTGLLIRQRRQSGSTAALLRRHQAQIGATPHLGGGASLIGGFHF
jgi:hypothetical protein